MDLLAQHAEHEVLLALVSAEFGVRGAHFGDTTGPQTGGPETR
jgi:hypothetical protein